jgi:transcriptional regulator with XRE-family HTH domain
MQLLAKRVKEYRLAARLSQKEMAEKSGVGQATISHFEQGINPNMTINNLISLLRVVGMEMRVAELLPELPMHQLSLREINKIIPKRVRRK